MSPPRRSLPVRSRAPSSTSAPGADPPPPHRPLPTSTPTTSTSADGPPAAEHHQSTAPPVQERAPKGRLLLPTMSAAMGHARREDDHGEAGTGTEKVRVSTRRISTADMMGFVAYISLSKQSQPLHRGNQEGGEVRGGGRRADFPSDTFAEKGHVLNSTHYPVQFTPRLFVVCHGGMFRK